MNSTHWIEKAVLDGVPREGVSTIITITNIRGGSVVSPVSCRVGELVARFFLRKNNARQSYVLSEVHFVVKRSRL